MDHTAFHLVDSQFPPLQADGLSPAQRSLLVDLERGLSEHQVRTLVWLPPAKGNSELVKTSMQRLVQFARDRRVLALLSPVHLLRLNLCGEQDSFSRLHTLQDALPHLVDRDHGDIPMLLVTTFRKLYALSRPTGDESRASEETPPLGRDAFDAFIVYEMPRPSLLWRQVLDYFEAYLVGFTGVLDWKRLAFFDGNLVASDQAQVWRGFARLEDRLAVYAAAQEHSCPPLVERKQRALPCRCVACKTAPAGWSTH